MWHVKCLRGGNYSSTEQVNSIQQFLAYSLITGTGVDIGEIIYSDLVTKLLNKSRLKYVSYPRFISCALQVLLGSDYTQDENFRFLPGILSHSNFTKDPSKVTDTELAAHMIAVNNQMDSGPEASGALSKKSKRPKSKKTPTETKATPLKPMKGLPSTLDEGTRKSKPLHEGTVTHPKDSGGNIQPLDRDLTSMTSEEGSAKTTPRPEGSLRDKDSGGIIPPADMEPINTPVADPPGTVAKYQVDKIQSTRLRQQSLTENKGKTSSEVEPDTEPLKLQTFVDVQAFLLSEDELDKESDKEEVVVVGEDMDKDIHVVEEVRTPSPKQDQPEPSNYLRKMSRVLFHRITEDNWKKHEEAAVNYANLKASIDEYYGKTWLTESTVKDLQAHALKQDEELAAWAKSSTNMAWNLGFRISGLKRAQNHIKTSMSSLQEDITSIKSMMTEMYDAFRGQSSLAPSGSVTPTLALTRIPTNFKGENATQTATEEPPSHTEGETDANKQEKPEEPKQSTDPNIEFIGSSTHQPSITQA
ncbi:hypothetical protein Tco_0752583 [Tanacetum coccineum]|uniref:Uncharacterized protein n=1 Tax=Tanacetum coccineum TaxID=301880 RepID=A0ABQ4Z871_9ASTR